MKKISPPPPPTPAVPTPAVTNPDYPDFPDPFVFRDEAPDYLAASTNAIPAGGNIQHRMPTVEATATLATWDGTDDLFDADQAAPTWVAGGGQDYAYWWAPAVWRRAADSYFLYFTARHSSGRQCIGGATSSTPEGPYTVTAAFMNNPVVCQPTTGSIDPSVFVDAGGQAWLLWKSDGNCCAVESHIWARRLGADGRLSGAGAVPLIGTNQAWEFGTSSATSTVEGPSMVAAGGSYYLFYSGNYWQSPNYATGYAVCAAIAAGACTKPQDGPILASGPNGLGPGGAEVLSDHDGRRWLAYHAWNPNRPISYPNGQRRLHITELNFSSGTPGFGSSP